MRLRYIALLMIFIVGGCAQLMQNAHVQRIMARLSPDMTTHHVALGDEVFIRIFKEENILELWMRGDDRYHYSLIKTYTICNWSGALGPKFREGDRQSPEGFYATTLDNLNPNSLYHLSFNIQFPNRYDTYHGRTGTHLMVHGDCVSDGCYAMTDPMMEEIYLIVEMALRNGQDEVPVHIFPFKMTDDRLHTEFMSRHFDYWKNLKQGYDYFETHHIPPKWIVRNGRYDFY